MTPGRIILRGLVYHWRTNLCVIAGLAVATAVITGSLMVGDSMTGTLRRLALSRIGLIDHVIATPTFFRAALAKDLPGRTDACILISGIARIADADSGSVRVNLCGVDDAFWDLFPDSPRAKLNGRDIAISQALAEDLGVKVGDELLVSLPRPSLIPGSTLFARRKTEQTIRSVRVAVKAILPQRGAGGFNLQAGSASVGNIFIAGEFLGQSLEKPGLANVLLVATDGRTGDELQAAINRVCALSDYGLRLNHNAQLGYFSLESDAILLTPQQIRAAEAAAQSTAAELAQSSVYLATRISSTSGGAGSLSYAIVAAIDPSPGFKFFSGGADVADNGLLLNQWAGQDLSAPIGQSLELSTLAAQPDGSYREIPMRVELRGILAMEGAAADAMLTPSLAGLTDAARIDRWDVPFPVELDRVSDRDDQYWERYRATPKAFVSMSTMQRIWSSATSLQGPFITSLRITPRQGADLDDAASRLEAAIVRELPASGAALAVRPIRQELLQASRGSTDFGSLLLAMGFFLIAAAVGLAGTLMRLSISRRASEMGVMLSCGLSPRKAGRVFLVEGAVLAVIGAAIGVPLGAGYCWAVLMGLSRVAADVWNGPSFGLHLNASTLAIGGFIGLVIGIFCAAWGLRSLKGRPVLMLLGGWQRVALRASSPRRSAVALVMALVTGIFLPILSLLWTGLSATVAFFIGGACLLVAGILFARLALSIRTSSGRLMSIPRLALRNASANRARSLLVVGLLASASFILVAVAANRRDVPESAIVSRDGGAGGFSLRATTALPLRYDISTTLGRQNLGFSDADRQLLAGATIVPFMAVAGDDISCRSLARPVRPTLLGASQAMIARGGFSVRLAAGLNDPNPWTALLADDPDGAIPVFGDSDSVQWILHGRPGGVLNISGPNDTPLKLRIVGVIPGSVFAGELIMSEQHLRRIYGESAGQSYFFIDAPRDRLDEVARMLRRRLDDFGIEVQLTRRIIAGFVAVQNLYLSIFLMLGGLGMLLGAAGMLTVILRNVLERRKEMALMLACGFSRRRLIAVVAMEHAGLLMAGLACGTVAAAIAVAPTVLGSQSNVNWSMLTALLASITVIGMLGCVIGAIGAVRSNLVAALRQE